MLFNFEYPTLKPLSDPLTHYNHNEGQNGGHYAGQPLRKVPSPTAQGNICITMFVTGFEPGTS